MRTKSLFHRLVLATVLAAGFLFLWGVIGVWGLEVSMMIAECHRRIVQLSFLADGSPVVVRYESDGKPSYRDLAGNPVPQPENEQTGWLNPTHLPARLPRAGGGDVPWEQRIHTYDDGRTPSVVWHFVSDGRPEGAGYFVGYDSQSKACVGYLGTAGFRDVMPSAEELFPFSREEPGAGSRLLSLDRKRKTANRDSSLIRVEAVETASPGRWIVHVFGRDGKLYKADLRKRTVRVILDEPGLRSVAFVSEAQTSPRSYSDRLAARSEDAVLVLDSEGQVLKRYAIPEALRAESISFGETTAGEALMYNSGQEDFLDTEVEYRICWVAPDGRVREKAVTLPYYHPMRSLQTVSAAVVPSPLVLDGLVTGLRTSQLRDDAMEPTFSAALLRALTEFWPALAIAQLIALGLAVLCYRRQLRYGVSRGERIVWPLFVLLLGLPGWIGYRFGRRWPVLEKCPTCGDAVPRDRGECVRCAVEFPMPALKGTEVFA